MKLRHQLPAHSPISVKALFAGLSGALGRDAQASLRQRIRAHWQATDLELAGSGTTALTLILRAVTPGRTPLVALPAYGCYDLASAVVGANATAILYDIDPDTLAPAPESLERALEQRPDVLLLAHLFGFPIDVAAIAATARARNTLVVEDAAQAFGAAFQGKPAGAFGSISVLSFGRGKGLTGGGGGAVFSRDPVGDELVGRIRSMLPAPRSGWSELARTGLQWVLGRPELYGLPAALPFLRLGETVYREPQLVSSMSDAAINLVDSVWTDSLAAVQTRRRNAESLAAAASESTVWGRVASSALAEPGYLRLPLRALRGSSRMLVSQQARRLGVMRGYPLALADLPGFREFCSSPAETPGARTLAESLITLPTHSLLSARDLTELTDWLGRPLPAEPAASQAKKNKRQFA